MIHRKTSKGSRTRTVSGGPAQAGEVWMTEQTRAYKLKIFPTDSKAEIARYALDRAQSYLRPLIGHMLFSGAKISTKGQGQLFNQMAHQAKGKARAIKESSKETGNKWNVPLNPMPEIPVKISKNKNSSFDYWVHVPDLFEKSKTVKIPAKSHKALNGVLRTGWSLSKWAYLKEGYILVFVSKEVKRAKIKKTDCLGIDVGLKHAYSDSLGNLSDGLGRKIRKAKHRQAERSRQGHRKKRNLQINKSIIKQVLDRHAKKIIDRALSFSKVNISVENPVTIGNISRGKLTGWAGAYEARRLQILGKENSIPVIFVNPWKTSLTCSECGEKDRVIREKNKFSCSSCGIAIHADLNAAKNISLKGAQIAEKILLNQAAKNLGRRA